MRSHGLGMSSHGLGMGEKPQPKPLPAPPKPEPMPSLKGLNIPQPAQPKPVNQERLKSVIADFKAKQQQGGVQNLLQNGTTSDATAKPIGTADINTNQLGHLKPLGTTPALTPEASASNARLAAASAKTTDHSLLKRDVTDALKTGGVQAQAEVQDLTQQMNDLQPGSGTKLAQEVGLEIQVPTGATTLSAGTDNSVGQKDGGNRLATSQSQDVPKINFNTNGFGDTLSDSAEKKSTGNCAKYVRRALEAGGLDSSGHPTNAKDWGPTLEKNNFKPLKQEKYTPKKGDVVVIQPYPGGRPEGHMAAYNGKQWISDFKQRDMWAGPGYRKHKPPHVIYRKTP